MKFLPLQTVAKREKPFSCNLLSAQEGSLLQKENPLQGSGKSSAGLQKEQKNTSLGFNAAVKKPGYRFGTSMILTELESGMSGEIICSKCMVH